MTDNKQLYSYIVHSLDILNKSLTINEQNTVKLFSYLYNNSLSTEKIFESKINNINSYISNNVNIINDDIKNLENCIIKINNEITTLQNNLNNTNKNIKKINADLLKYNENIIEVPIIISDKISFVYKLEDEYIKLKHNIIELFSKIKIFYIKIYDKIYKFIFRKRIQKEKEESELRRQEEIKRQEEELRRQQIEKDKKRKELIQQILNTPFNNKNGH